MAETPITAFPITMDVKEGSRCGKVLGQDKCKLKKSQKDGKT